MATKGRAKKGCKIEVTRNGPYVVSGGVPLSERAIAIDSDGECHGWQAGREHPVEESYKLCRCGGSHNKPFCDTTHEKKGFVGTETATQEPYLHQAKRFEGPGLDLTDAPALCSTARFCHRMGGAWKLTRESDRPEAKAALIEEGADCPSGRLVVWDKEGKPIEPELEPCIALVEDTQAGVQGPLQVRGGIPVESADGVAYEVRNRVTLCRCGKSKNKPFCDGQHLPG